MAITVSRVTQNLFMGCHMALVANGCFRAHYFGLTRFHAMDLHCFVFFLFCVLSNGNKLIFCFFRNFFVPDIMLVQILTIFTIFTPVSYFLHIYNFLQIGVGGISAFKRFVCSKSGTFLKQNSATKKITKIFFCRSYL